jgi:hypothetical protein
MRKFTTLEEDLIKENAQLQEKFDLEMNQALDNLDKIQKALTAHKEEYLNNAGNWGYVGSLEHVNELLNDILEFISTPEPFME